MRNTNAYGITGKKNGKMKKAIAAICAALTITVCAAGAASAAPAQATNQSYNVHVDSGYLALRNGKAYDYNNEIGKLYNTDTVVVLDSSDPTYSYVYAPRLNAYGYVIKNYIYKNVTPEPAPGSYSTVKVASGYLALRSGKAYDYRNEIGKLYTGDSVQVINKESGDYWYVYAPKLGAYGYVNKNYLV